MKNLTNENQTTLTSVDYANILCAFTYRNCDLIMQLKKHGYSSLTKAIIADNKKTFIKTYKTMFPLYSDYKAIQYYKETMHCVLKYYSQKHH